MELSDDGLFFLARKEGIVPGPYLDTVGVWTYGIGHAETSGRDPNPRHMRRGMPTDLDAELSGVFKVFREDMEVFSQAVRQSVTAPMTQYEFDAAVSFHYNTGAIRKATWVKTWNAGDKDKAVRQIMNWSKPPEIIGRREQERELFRIGDYGQGKIPVYQVDENGRYGRVVRSLGREEFLALLRPNGKPTQKQPNPQGKGMTTGEGLVGLIVAVALGAFGYFTGLFGG